MRVVGSHRVSGYVVIETQYDEVVTPYTNAFLPAAPTCRTSSCRTSAQTDFTEHLGIIYDPVALQDVMNALGPRQTWLPSHLFDRPSGAGLSTSRESE